MVSRATDEGPSSLADTCRQAVADLSRIARLNPRINAYVEVTHERAREDARRATDEIAGGTYRGPLHGVPIALKDLYDTAGIHTAGGAKILADRMPEADSTVARKLRAEIRDVPVPDFGPVTAPASTGAHIGSGQCLTAGLASLAIATFTHAG